MCEILCVCVCLFKLPLCVFFVGKAAFAARRKEERMPSPPFFLDAQLRFHDKWLRIDLQVKEKVYLL